MYILHSHHISKHAHALVRKHRFTYIHVYVHLEFSLLSSICIHPRTNSICTHTHLNTLLIRTSNFHNDWFFLAKKENIVVPNAIEKHRTGAFRSQDHMLSFFQAKKNNHYENESTSQSHTIIKHLHAPTHKCNTHTYTSHTLLTCTRTYEPQSYPIVKHLHTPTHKRNAHTYTLTYTSLRYFTCICKHASQSHPIVKHLHAPTHKRDSNLTTWTVITFKSTIFD